MSLPLCLNAAADGAAAPAAPTRQHRVYETTRLTVAPPVIDGRLDDACWNSLGAWSSGYTQLTPKYAAAPSQSTDIKILFDDRNIYVAMRAHDEPIARRARQLGNRDGFAGDIMGVNFDSYHDRRTGFEFDLTAAGQKIDLVLLNNSWDTTWNPVWEGKVAHSDDGWTAEFLIPLSQLRFDPTNTVWGLHSWRWIDRFKEESDWNLLANDDSGFVKSFGELHGLTGLRANRRWEVAPYALVRTDTAPGRSAETELRGGVDAKLGLSANITLDASLLPDFGQVEADPAVMNLSAFETFLTEKRPLFLEGKDIFTLPFGDDTLFYSRRIGQPPSYAPANRVSDMPDSSTLLGALKVSGKTNYGTSFGVLAAATDRESVDVQDGTSTRGVTVAPRTAYLVARGQQDLRAGDTVVGGMLTRLERESLSPELAGWLADTSSALAGDVVHYWQEREYFARAVAVGTQVEGDPRAIARLQRNSTHYFQRPKSDGARFDPTLDSLEGAGLWLQGGKASKGHWRWTEDVFLKSAGLDFNELGYLAQADQRQANTTIVYIEKDPRAWYRMYEIKAEQNNTWTNDGEFLGATGCVRGSVELSNKWTLGGCLGGGGAGRDSVALRGGPLLYTPAYANWSSSLETDGTKSVWLGVYAEGRQSAQSVFHQDSYSAKVSYRPRDSLTFSVAAEATRYSDRHQFVGTESLQSASRYIVSHLEAESRSLAFRAEWHLRPELSLQYYGNPFGSTVRFGEYRQVLAPDASNFSQRLSPALRASSFNGRTLLDANGDGAADFALDQPDWNDDSFHSNLVLRWEYRLGSTLYLAWSQQRYGGSSALNESAWSTLTRLRSQPPSNQFMMKITYWFSS